ncbi:MAG: LOG family protein [Nanoarchaeota archaeon]|nr:LOG family protein [Nanoarchaeota archaeon]MCG2717912.1 LOG family protein [Nanoarchaeota archaeon]
MIITVFGGSRPDEETYELAYQLGKRIAKKGHVLKNGGNCGTMEAASKGASEEGGKVIGVIVDNEHIPELAKGNIYSTEVIRFSDYQRRVQELMKAERFIVLPGQIGTLDEFFVSWVHAVVNNLPPVIVIGQRNKELLDFLIDKGFVKSDQHFKYVQFVESVDDIDFLR